MSPPRAVLLLILAFLLAGRGLAEPTPDTNPAETPVPAAPEETQAAPAGTKLVWWNREITTFRATAESMTPELRAADALEKLQNASEEDLKKGFQTEKASFEEQDSIRFLAGETYLFSLLEDDLDALSGEKLDELATTTLAALEEVRTARANQASAEYLAKSAVRSVVATLIFLVAVFLLFTITRKLSSLAVNRTKSWRRLRIKRADFRPHIAAVVEQAIKVSAFFLALYAFCVWIAYVFNQFPRTEPFGNVFTNHLLGFGKSVLIQIVEALPGIATAAIILFIARWVARLADRTIEGLGDDSNKGVMATDTAKATRRITVACVWLFAIVLAYPYLPGSGSEAFKGLSVLVGLMLSLGSSGLINQVMSGFVLLYSGSVRTGEYIKVGEIEGTITEMGLLAVKVLNPAQEFLVIPNAVMLANPMTNFSRLREDTGVPLKTSVTIGYDTPWRLVHQLLEDSAKATTGVLENPAPCVRQNALSDWYPEYTLICYLTDPSKRIATLSELNGHIQDAFNDAKIQIMSPHYHKDPPEPLIIPKERWFPSRNEPPAGGSPAKP